MRLSELKELFGDARLLSDAEFLCLDFIKSVYGTKNLTFIKEEKYLKQLGVGKNNVAAVITTPEVARQIPLDKYGCIVTENPEKLYYHIHNYLASNTEFYGKDKQNKIDGTAKIASNVTIADKNVIIGANTIIEPNVVIMENVTIGENVFIGAGTIIGERGFQYYRENGKLQHVKHVGRVIIEDDVHIYCNCVIYRGLVNNTVIKKDAKVNSLTNVGHGVTVGEHALISAGALLAGSSIIGDNAWIGLNGTIKQRITLGEDSYVCMGAIVTKDVRAGQKVSGNFAVEHEKQVENIKQIIRQT